MSGATGCGKLSHALEIFFYLFRLQTASALPQYSRAGTTSICFTKVRFILSLYTHTHTHTCTHTRTRTHTHRVPVYEYVCYYLLYLVGGRILLNTLAIGVDTVNYLYNTRHRYTSSGSCIVIVTFSSVVWCV